LRNGVGGTLVAASMLAQLGVGVGRVARQRLLRVARAVAALQPLGLLGEARSRSACSRAISAGLGRAPTT
jgi:hypothetical protein